MSDQKNILIIDNSLDTTGAFNSILRNVLDLKDHFNFIFVLPKKSKNSEVLKKHGLTFYKLNIKEIRKSLIGLIIYLPYLILNSYKLSRIIKREHISLVHVNDVYNMLGILAKLFARFKLLAHIRRMPESFPIILYRLWRLLHLSFTNTLIAVSRANAEFFAGHSNVVVIYDPILEQAECHQTAFSEKKIKLLYLANYTRGKGQEHAIHIIKNLKAACKEEITLNFYGGDFGIKKNAAFKKELIQFVKEENLAEGINFYDKAHDIEKLMKSHDIALNFSESESFSNVSLEALYYGVPLVATNVGGQAEMFENGISGILVEKGDYQTATVALKKLIENVGLRAQMGNNARKFVRENFNKENTSYRLKMIYRNA